MGLTGESGLPAPRDMTSDIEAGGVMTTESEQTSWPPLVAAATFLAAQSSPAASVPWCPAMHHRAQTGQQGLQTDSKGTELSRPGWAAVAGLGCTGAVDGASTSSVAQKEM